MTLARGTHIFRPTIMAAAVSEAFRRLRAIHVVVVERGRVVFEDVAPFYSQRPMGRSAGALNYPVKL